MIDERARGATGVFPGRFAQAVRFRVALLRTEVAVGSPELARVGLVTLAMALQMALLFMPGHFRPAPNPFLATVVPLGTLASLGISVFAGLSVKSLCSVRVRQFLAGGALAGLAILSIIGLWEGTLGLRAMVHGTPYGNDGAVMDLYAAQQVRHGLHVTEVVERDDVDVVSAGLHGPPQVPADTAESVDSNTDGHDAPPTLAHTDSCRPA